MKPRRYNAWAVDVWETMPSKRTRFQLFRALLASGETSHAPNAARLPWRLFRGETLPVDEQMRLRRRFFWRGEIRDEPPRPRELPEIDPQGWPGGFESGWWEPHEQTIAEARKRNASRAAAVRRRSGERLSRVWHKGLPEAREPLSWTRPSHLSHPSRRRPRGRCGYCGRDVPLTAHGVAWTHAHTVGLYDGTQDCPGGGQPPSVPPSMVPVDRQAVSALLLLEA